KPISRKTSGHKFTGPCFFPANVWQHICRTVVLPSPTVSDFAHVEMVAKELFQLLDIAGIVFGLPHLVWLPDGHDVAVVSAGIGPERKFCAAFMKAPVDGFGVVAGAELPRYSVFAIGSQDGVVNHHAFWGMGGVDGMPCFHRSFFRSYHHVPVLFFHPGYTRIFINDTAF